MRIQDRDATCDGSSMVRQHISDQCSVCSRSFVLTMRISLFCTLLLAAIDTSVNGFVTKSTVQNSFGLANGNRSNNAPHLLTPSRQQQQKQQGARTVQQMANKSSYDGKNRGYVIQTIVLSICVWFFSIPPEFRRTHFCPTSKCVEDRASCYDCVTFGEWKVRVADYYKGGGGVHFDFSIDPATKEANKEIMDSVLKR
jgi:hypothetical protein